MQELNLNLKVHDIMKGDTPPEEGYCTIIVTSVDDRAELEPMYWKDGAWLSHEKSDSPMEPNEFWGRYWIEDITNVLERNGLYERQF